jgi:hypothetical protein
MCPRIYFSYEQEADSFCAFHSRTVTLMHFAADVLEFTSLVNKKLSYLCVLV